MHFHNNNKKKLNQHNQHKQICFLFLPQGAPALHKPVEGEMGGITIQLLN